MCIYSKYITNPYTRKRILVPCGKCESCRQRKANARARRIKNHEVAGEVILFCTLTYRNECIPYILRKELLNLENSGFPTLNVYRNYKARVYHGRFKDNECRMPIDTFSFDVNDFYTFSSNAKQVHSPTRMKKGIIGVIYYKDLQDFMKRLRINLVRKYNYHEQISYFACAEYGPKTDRPHFHLLIFCKSIAFEKVQSAISESWTYGNKDRTDMYCEIAKDASAYVASYVNCDNASSKVFAKTPFSQTHSFSKGFGVRMECFSVASILEKVARNTLTYRIEANIDHIPTLVDVPVPKYVINRYFPKFKGYSVTTDDEVRKFLLVPSKLAQLVKSRNPLMSWTDDDLREYKVRLNNLCSFFCKNITFTDDLGVVSHLSEDEFWANYADWYVNTWNCYQSTILKMSYRGIFCLDDYLEHYENIADAFTWWHDGNIIRSLSVHSDLSDLVVPSYRHWDYNQRRDIVNDHFALLELYNKKDKTRKLLNHVHSELGKNV